MTTYQSGSESEFLKLDILRGLINRNVNLNDSELADLLGFSVDKVHDVRSSQTKTTLDSANYPLSWDYVLAFKVGNDKDVVKPSRKAKKHRRDEDEDMNEEWEHGMPKKKYFGQIFSNVWKRLEAARLTVQAFKSADGKTMFLVVGITESSLKDWADQRDTDLLCDRRGGILHGRERHFPLAMRTVLPAEDGNEFKMNDDGGGGGEETIPLSNWNSLYIQYNRYVPQSIYVQYPRVFGKDDIMTPFDEKTRLRIIYESMIADNNEGGAELAFEELILSGKHPMIDCFSLHNDRVLEEFDRNWIREYRPHKLMDCPLEDIRAYFGEPVAFYFGFLSFYLRWLILPSIVGIIFFVIQLLTEIDAPGIYIMCFFIIFWSVAFVDFWFRQESRYRLLWGMIKFEQKAVARPQFHGEWAHDDITGLWTEQFGLLRRGVRVSATLSGVLLFLAACMAAVFSILILRDSDPNNTELKIGLGVANGGMIFIFDMLYKFFSKFGNEWENHRTDQDFQNALIQKSFFFKFFNSFSSLFYLGFIRPWTQNDSYYIQNYDDVCSGSDTYMSAFYSYYSASGDTDGTYAECQTEACSDSTNACDKDCFLVVQTGYATNSTALGGSTSCGGGTVESDFCSSICSVLDTTIEINNAVLGELQLQLASLFITMIIIQNTLEVVLPFLFGKIRSIAREREAAQSGEELRELSEAEKQMELEPYPDTLDDMSEMVIQFGYVTLFVMALPITPLLAWINNVIEMKVDAINLCKTSQRPHPNGSYGLGSWNQMLQFFSFVAVLTNVGLITWRTSLVSKMFEDADDSYKWIFFTVLGLILALLVSAEKAIIPDMPFEVTEAIERQRLVESVLVLGANVQDFDENPPDNDDDDFVFDPSAQFVDAHSLPDIPISGLQFNLPNSAGGTYVISPQQQY